MFNNEEDDKYYEILSKVTEKYNIKVINEQQVKLEINNKSYSIIDFTKLKNIFIINIFYQKTNYIFDIIDKLFEIKEMDKEKEIDNYEREIITENLTELIVTFVDILLNTIQSKNDIQLKENSQGIRNYMLSLAQIKDFTELFNFWNDYLFIIEFAIRTGQKKNEKNYNTILNSFPDNESIELNVLDENNNAKKIVLKNKEELKNYMHNISKHMFKKIYPDINITKKLENSDEYDLENIQCINTKPC